MSAEPGVIETFADYFDGETAIVHRIALRLMPDRLTITLPDGASEEWLATELREVPDQADPTAVLLSRAGDPLTRLHVADPEIAKLLRRNAPALRQRPPVENKGRIAAWATGAVASVALIIFVLVPSMANQLAAFLPPEGERALGDATFEQIRMALGQDVLPVDICDGDDGLAALAKMEARLDAGSDLPYPIEVTVLDHDLVNAFALPGGRIVFFRGLFEEADSPEEVAAIFAHEMGHVVNRDPTRDALRWAGSIGVLGLIFGDFAGGTVVLMLANELINAQYSQAAEAGADDYAHALLTRAGLPPAALGTFFERLKEEYGDAEGIYAHFSTHPQMTARIEAALVAQQAAEAAGETFDPVLTPAEWDDLRGVCGAGAKADPDPQSDGSGRLGRD